MATTSLNKNLAEILKDQYVVPLYQRNFSWGVDEISQLLQDMYDAFRKNREGNYFIGSLVVLKRRDSAFEVVDGQQRLTVITLMAKILGVEEIKPSNLSYDSRPEFEAFFNSSYGTGETGDVTFDHEVSHLVRAVDIIKETKLEPDKTDPDKTDSAITIKELKGNDEFKNFFVGKVILVKVEMSKDTDVAAYFEIMNNRGEQLQKHEKLKAEIMEKIENEQKRKDFAKVWDACSQMDVRIQKLFVTNDRKRYFQENYDGFNCLIDGNYDQNMANQNDSDGDNIDTIIDKHAVTNNGEPSNGNIGNEKSIIDFPNFLMHVFRLLHNDDYKKSAPNNGEGGQDIPLNEKYLLDVFDKIENEIVPVKFVSKLLYYRMIFDRYVVRALDDSTGNGHWSLRKPCKGKKEKLGYKNTFGDKQERIVKCLSMLQVTYRSKTYKNWLQEVLSWFECPKCDMPKEKYQEKLDRLALSHYTFEDEINGTCYSKGTGTPHFLFNFIDYLYWVESKKKRNGIRHIDKVRNFTFKYRNSVEHHRPQSCRKDDDDDYNRLIDCLGNLCLVSKSSNSKMNNEEPSGKAIKYGGFELPPKRKIMYEITKESKSALKWDEDEIIEHHDGVVDLLDKREKILGVPPLWRMSFKGRTIRKHCRRVGKQSNSSGEGHEIPVRHL